MPEIRSVSVRLDADVAGYIAKMKLAGDATDRAFSSSSRSIDTNTSKLAASERELGKVDTATRKVSTSTRKMGDDVDRTRVKVDAGLKSIDKYSGRLGVLLDVGLALVPALAPIGAELVPATAALGGNVLSLGVGLGVTKLAFHGLGTALTAFNKAALDPTAANIKAAQLAMDKLPPSAQRFVLELHKLGPEVERLQKISANGILPGARAGLRDLETDLPIVRAGIRGTSQEIGTLARDTGQALSSRTWRPFIRFLGTEAPAALDTLGRAGGHTLHGLATLLMGFGSTTREIDQGILNLARDFDRWATVTERSKGFEDFLDYLRENGPRVLDLLGQTAVTFVDIGRAVAPLGGPTLDILTKLLGIVDDIAQSDLGTPLFAGIVAWRLYARVAQLAGVQVETSFKGVLAAPGQMGTKLNQLTEQTTRWSRTTIADIDAVVRAYALAGRASLTNPSRSLAMSQERLGSRFGTALKGGAAAAGIALIASGAADKIGLTNAASLALAGSLAGPVGAAIGGTIGLTMDLAHSNDTLVGSIHAVQASLDSGSGVAVSFQDQQQKLAGLNKELGDYEASLRDVGSVQGLLRSTSDLFTHTGDDAKSAAADMREFTTLSSIAFTQIGKGLNGVGDLGKNFFSDNALQKVADRAQPAMLALGISVDDLNAAAKRGDGSLGRMTNQIVAWINHADSASGRTDAVAKAFASMSDQTLTLDDRVQALSDSLDALLGPTLGLSAASDQYTKDLHTLGGELSKHSKTLKGNSDAALTNREAIRTRVTDLSNLIKAEAQAGASPEKLTRTLKTQRQALIDAGAAAGISRAQMKDYLDQLGLTPKLIRTAISLLGVDQAAGQLKGLRSQLEGLKDRTIHIYVRTDHLGEQDTTATGGHVQTGHAGGGTVTGAPRWPYGDKVLRRLAPGEEVISNRFGQADLNRGALKAANRGARLAVIGGPGGMAGGGTVERHHVSTNLVSTTNSSRVTERIVERLPTRMRLAVDGDDLYAVLDSVSQDNYEANRTYEEAHG